MSKKGKSFLLLGVLLVVFFLGLIIAHGAETSGGKVDVDRLLLSTDDNYTLSVKLWRPKTATAKTPAPGIILVPGGNASLEYMSSTALELARRGYVTMAIDPYTIGRSEVAPSTPNLGTTYALSYLQALDYVDATKIGLGGWSAGVGRVSGAIYNADKTIKAGVQAVLNIGAGAFFALDVDVNQGTFIGRFDNTYGRGVDRQVDINTAKAFISVVGKDKVEFGTWYGDLANGKGRVLYSGFTGHILELVSKSFISSACDFFDTALAPGNGVSNFIFGWKEFGTLLAMATLIAAMIVLCNMLLQLAYFAPVFNRNEKAVLKANSKSWIMWALFGVSVIFGALITKTAVYNGQMLLNKTKFLQIANVNGFVFWLICLSAFSLALLVARLFLDKSIDRSSLKAHLQISTQSLGRTIVLSLAGILFAYFMVSLADQFFTISPRIWKVQMNILNPKRFSLFLIYFPCYLIPMLIINYMQTSSYYIEENKRLSTFLVWASNTLPALLFVIYVYGSIFIKGVTPITNAAMSRANGTMLDAVILMIPISFIAAHFYRKTKNFYFPAILNSMLFAWLAVCTDLITYLA